MKKFFFCAAAAIVALASCSKTQVVYNDAPEEIGFKAVSGVMTKAANLGDQAHETMGVFANYNADKSQYFGNTSFAPASADEWVANPKKYWPLEGALDFAYYAPYNGTAAGWTYTNEATKLAITVDNTTTQTDWLYGTAVLTNQTKKNTAMPVTLRHALAKITVNVTSDLNNLVINSVNVTGTAQSGALAVDYKGNDADFTDGDSRLSWTGTTTKDWTIIPASYTFSAENTQATGTCYVIPSAQTTITMSYALPADGTPRTYTHTLTGNWVDGISYTYNIKINANEIKFEPTAQEWATNSTDIPVDPNTPSNN